MGKNSTPFVQNGIMNIRGVKVPLIATPSSTWDVVIGNATYHITQEQEESLLRCVLYHKNLPSTGRIAEFNFSGQRRSAPSSAVIYQRVLQDHHCDDGNGLKTCEEFFDPPESVLHFFKNIALPNLGIALTGLFFAKFWLDVMKWMSHTYKQQFIFESAPLIDLFLILICTSPIWLTRQGRIKICDILKHPCARWFIVISVMIWWIAISECISPTRYELTHSLTVLEYLWQIVSGFIGLLAGGYAIIGMFIGIFTFIVFLFQRNPQPFNK